MEKYKLVWITGLSFTQLYFISYDSFSLGKYQSKAKISLLIPKSQIYWYSHDLNNRQSGIQMVLSIPIAKWSTLQSTIQKANVFLRYLNNQTNHKTIHYFNNRLHAACQLNFRYLDGILTVCPLSQSHLYICVRQCLFVFSFQW